MWLALSVRGGGAVPPRILKKRWSFRESRDLFAYYRRYPFDDESNFWFPMAQFMALYINSHLGKDKPPVSPLDLMPFRVRAEGKELDEDDDDAGDEENI